MQIDFLIFCSGNLARLVSYIPSYEDMKKTLINNPFSQSIKTLLFANWPQDEIYPASIEDFVREIYDTRTSIFNALFSATREGLNHDGTEYNVDYILTDYDYEQ